MGDVFTWMEHILVPNLYADTLYNGEVVHWREKSWLTDRTYYRVGQPRLRLARIDGTGNYRRYIGLIGQIIIFHQKKIIPG